MNILITGCNGQLGNEMQLLQRENPQHTFINTDVDTLDITSQDDVERCIDQNKVDIVVNCAAYTAVDKAEGDKQLATALNTLAPAYLAAAVQKRSGALVQISTDYVFNGQAHTPYTEDDTPSPDSVYGSTKLAGELGAAKLCARTMVIRTAWLYSTFGNNFVKTMLRLGKERERLGVVFDQIGTPTCARDLAKAIMAAINQGVKPGVYHYSNEGVCSWYDFAKAIHRMAGITTCRLYPIHTSEYPTPAHRPPYSVLDKTKIKRAYGIDIPHWEDSLRECVGEIVNSGQCF